MSSKLNWGILGAGNIAGQFTRDLVLNNKDDSAKFKHIIAAIGLLDQAKGEKFVLDNGIEGEGNCNIAPKIQLYDAFYTNPDIDVVYIATPHVFHKEQVTKAILAGKNVLCEKPMTVNRKDAADLVALARKHKRYLLEGVWTRFFPAVEALKKLVFEDKAIGEVNRLFVDFAYNGDVATLPVSSRVRDVKLGAGCLLDIGIYSLTWARLLLDQQSGEGHKKFNVVSSLYLDPQDKVDHKAAFIIQYADGLQAICTLSELSDGRQPFGRLEGSEGHIEAFAANPACPKKFEVHFRDEKRKTVTFETKTDYLGFLYEANAVAEDLLAGRLENDLMPHDETLLMMQVMDKIRMDNGLQYPQDE